MMPDEDETLGAPIAELAQLAEEPRKGFGDRVLIKDLSFDLPAGAILGVVGANGMGKSTLLRMILGNAADFCGIPGGLANSDHVQPLARR